MDFSHYKPIAELNEVEENLLKILEHSYKILESVEKKEENSETTKNLFALLKDVKTTLTLYIQNLNNFPTVPFENNTNEEKKKLKLTLEKISYFQQQLSKIC